MSIVWRFLEGSPSLGLSVSNVLVPDDVTESLLAVVDTGYTGFLMLPEPLFEKLRFSELKTEGTTATLADGREVTLRSAYGLIAIQGVELEVAGQVQTFDGAEETLLGMDGLREFSITIDSCDQVSTVRRC